MRFHASCAARPGSGGFDAVLILGESGAGKSDLLLRLLDRGWRLVADDQVMAAGGDVWPPPGVAGLLEVRGLGIFRLPYLERARLRLVVRLGRQAQRLPEPAWHAALGVPEILLDPGLHSAPERIGLALDAATGRAANIAGAFAA